MPQKRTIPRTCEQCGTAFLATLQAVKSGGGRYCSRKCGGDAQRPAPRSCEHCGEPFLTRPSKVAKGDGKYCSRKCYGEAHQKRIDRTCGVCGKHFVALHCAVIRGNGRFCSRSCKTRDMIRKRDENRPSAKVSHTCEICGKVTSQYRYSKIRKERRFCSKRCMALAMREERRGENGPNWKGGIATRMYPRTSEMSRTRYKEWRHAIFCRDRFTCQMCGLSGCQLHAHHLKTWRDFPESRYELTNGITLCVLCHRQIKHSGPILSYTQRSLYI